MDRALALVQSDVEAVLGHGRAARLDKLHGEHLFISGGTGFLGTWLLELIKGLNERHGFGIRATVYARNAREFAARHPHLGLLKGVRYEDGDIRHLAELPRDVRYIIHAAALTDRRLLSSQPVSVAEVNAVGAQRLLRAATLMEEVEKIVMLSSGLVYGEQPWDLPQVDESFAGPLLCNSVGSVYAESKRFAEAVACGAISESKLPIVILRPFAFVGPYQSLQLPWAVTDFMRDSFNGGPIRIMGDGATVRSLMYASDYAYWVLAALAVGRAREVYNVGSPEAVDLATLAHMITQLFSPSPEIRTRVGQTGHERNRLVPNVGRAMRDLGVEVTVPLAVAIQRSITWNRFLLSR
jgi:nucleoside-diphosphate-sugar epimerase